MSPKELKCPRPARSSPGVRKCGRAPAEYTDFCNSVISVDTHYRKENLN